MASLFLKGLHKGDTEAQALSLKTKYHDITVWCRLQRVWHGIYRQRYMKSKGATARLEIS